MPPDDARPAVWELRRAVLKRHRSDEYLSLVLDRLWPALLEQGARPLCLLSALVGAPPEETYLITGFRDVGEWEHLQSIFGEHGGLFVEEDVQLMRQSATRPSWPLDRRDRRSFYGLRRFLLHAKDWPEFVRSSETLWRVWEPRLDSVILGMFRASAGIDPLPVTLLTGYNSAAHWEETRALFRGGSADRPAGVSETEWREVIRDYRLRNLELPITAYVCLMRAHWPTV